MDLNLTKNLEELEKLFTSRMGEYEQKLQKVTTGNSSTHPDLTSLSQEFTEFKNFVWQTLSNMRTQIELLSLGLERHETVMRRKVLLLHGVSEKQHEKAIETVHRIISDRMKLSDISIDNIQVCHRLGSAQSKNRPILVRFFDIEHRQAVWENKTSLKGTGITVTEFLTQTRHRIFTTARKHFGIKHSWTVEGKIVVLLPDKSRRKIETMRELQALISQYPATPTPVDTVQVVTDPPASTNTQNAPKRTVNAPKKRR